MEFLYQFVVVVTASLEILHAQSQESADFEYMGCFRNAEIRDLRVLKDHERYLSELTIESCLIECTSAKMSYFGVEQVNMCYCGEAGSDFQIYGNSSKCKTPCAGNTIQRCGGQFAIDVYKIVSLCSHLANPAYGYVNQTIDTAWFECAEGYALQGPRVVTCNKTIYKWDELALPVCVEERGPNEIPAWFIVLLVLTVLLAVLFFGCTLYFRSKLESMIRIAENMPENIEANECETRNGYSVPFLQSPVYAQPNVLNKCTVDYKHSNDVHC